ncbi:MAG: hypothetical protein ACRBG0_15600 [Lewinella sp.]|uniref:hypothetical protein n=1 Tax=Lewinella sp. TaxID=2004506 RepID=UPI003D6B9A46
MMQPFEKTLPFKTDGAYHGFAEVSGMLHVERDHLELEFEIKDSFLGALKSGPKQLKIAYSDLSKLTYVRTLFKSRLELKLKRLRILSQFPGAKDGMISLKIKRKLKEETEDITTYVNLRIAEIGLEKLEG